MKNFRDFDLGQSLLLPPDMRDWLPEGHLARFVAEVLGELDLSAIYASYEADSRGRPAYHPQMMTGLLVYGYCTGVFSSRRLEQATYDTVAFRFLAADQHPDHDTIAAFRERHLAALQALFVQVLRLCSRAGLVQLGHVAVDGSKVQANASKHKAMSYQRMHEREAALVQRVRDLMQQAQTVDDTEDARYGRGQSGSTLPQELQRAQDRLQAIRTAKAALEAEAKAAAASAAATKAVEQAVTSQPTATTDAAQIAAEDAVGSDAPQSQPETADKSDTAADAPAGKTQYNFTDPESRIMKDGATKAFLQGYNGQIVVDSAQQIIVANDLSTQGNDYQLLAPMLAQAINNLGTTPNAASADAGYYADPQILDPRIQDIDLYIATGRQRPAPPDDNAAPPDNQPPPDDPPHPPTNSPPTTQHLTTRKHKQQRRDAMRTKLNTPAGQALYRMRKAIVEPVFGQIKAARNFRRFSFRGLAKAKAEWSLVCTTHNLLKLWRHRQPTA